MAYVKKTREEKEKEVRTLIEDTEKKIGQYFESPENIKEYLSFMSKFYNYSLNNSILIDKQFSGAVGVGSYAFWKQKGFKINKGEKGIKILVPQIGTDNFKNEKGEIKSVDKATKEEKLKIKNKELEVKKGRIHFAQGYVFEVSQTNARAQDLPNIFPNRWLDGGVKDYNDLYKGMEKIAKNIGVKIVEPKQELGVAKGVSYTTLKEIALNPRNTELQNVKTLIHELTHAKLHTMEKFNKYQTHEKEFQAELTAYTVCSHFGIDTSEYSLKYIHDWTKDRTLKDKKELLKEVRQTAVEYIETFEETLINIKEIEQKQQPAEKILPKTVELNEIGNSIKNLGEVATIITLEEEFIKYLLKKEPSIKTVFSEEYKTTEVSKVDKTKEKFHIYQFNNMPEKCFIGQKVNNTIKQLGAVATIETVKKDFKEFKKFEKEHSVTLNNDKTNIQEKKTMLVQELSL